MSYIPFVCSCFVTSGWVFFPLRTIPLTYLQCLDHKRKPELLIQNKQKGLAKKSAFPFWVLFSLVFSHLERLQFLG